jgi:signal transduction histidine kinase
MLDLGRLETSGELALRPVDLLALAEAAVQQTSAQAAAKEIHLSLRG